jgi:hypothetical protein
MDKGVCVGKYSSLPHHGRHFLGGGGVEGIREKKQEEIYCGKGGKCRKMKVNEGTWARED